MLLTNNFFAIAFYCCCLFFFSCDGQIKSLAHSQGMDNNGRSPTEQISATNYGKICPNYFFAVIQVQSKENFHKCN